MEKLWNYANSVDINKHWETLKNMNPLSSHAHVEVEREVNISRDAIAEVKNQEKQYYLPPNHERSSIMNKIETIMEHMKIPPRPPTDWNRTKEEALSYYLLNSRKTAKTLRKLVKDMWATVKADIANIQLQEYRKKKLEYLTTRKIGREESSIERSKERKSDDVNVERSRDLRKVDNRDFKKGEEQICDDKNRHRNEDRNLDKNLFNDDNRNLNRNDNIDKNLLKNDNRNLNGNEGNNILRDDNRNFNENQTFNRNEDNNFDKNYFNNTDYFGSDLRTNETPFLEGGKNRDHLRKEDRKFDDYRTRNYGMRDEDRKFDLGGPFRESDLTQK